MAKWLRVPALTQTDGTRARPATAATTAWSRRHRPRRDSRHQVHSVPGQRLQIQPAVDNIVSTPSSAASSVSPNRSDRPVAGPGLPNRTGRCGGSSSTARITFAREESPPTPRGAAIVMPSSTERWRTAYRRSASSGTRATNGGDGEPPPQRAGRAHPTPAQRPVTATSPGHGDHQPEEADEELSRCRNSAPTTNPKSAPMPTSAASATSRLRAGTAVRTQRHVAGSRMSASALSTLG